MKHAFIVFLVPGSVAQVDVRQQLNRLRTFGTGRSEFKVSAEETTVFEHVLPSDSFGVFTHFWITGAPSPGIGIDNATIRYYLDGEAQPSVEPKPPLAAGVGFDDLTVW